MSGSRLFSRPLVAVVLVVVMLLLDQAIKILVEAELPMHELVPVLPMLGLYRTHNLGVAFSMLSGMDGWVIVGLRLLIVAFVLWMWRRTDEDHQFAHLGYALIIAGALGNIIDRFVYGHVVDYVLFYTQTWSFAVFNLADACITVGAGLVLLQEIFVSQARDSR